MKELTQERIKELMHYDPDTGIFTWKTIHGRSCSSKVAGCRCEKNTKYYIIIGIDSFLYRAHRVAFLYMTGTIPDHNEEVDHINGDGTDNRWSNLRLVDRQTNCRNMRRHKHNTSGVSGVSWRSQRNSWRAYIMIDNKQIGLGHYADKFEAICARKSSEVKHGFHSNHGSDRPL